MKSLRDMVDQSLAPTDGASLAFFRAAFGVLVAAALVLDIAHGGVRTHFIEGQAVPVLQLLTRACVARAGKHRIPEEQPAERDLLRRCRIVSRCGGLARQRGDLWRCLCAARRRAHDRSKSAGRRETSLSPHGT